MFELLIIGALMALVFILALCKAAGDADDRAEDAWQKERE